MRVMHKMLLLRAFMLYYTQSSESSRGRKRGDARKDEFGLAGSRCDLVPRRPCTSFESEYEKGVYDYEPLY